MNRRSTVPTVKVGPVEKAQKWEYLTVEIKGLPKGWSPSYVWGHRAPQVDLVASPDLGMLILRLRRLKT